MQSRTKSKKGNVYIISLGFDDLFKIGKAVRFDERLQTLSASNPRLKEVMCIKVMDMTAREKGLHNMFKEKRLNRRELFKLDNKDIAEAKEYLRNNAAKVSKPPVARNRKPKSHHKAMPKKRRDFNIVEKLLKIFDLEKISLPTTEYALSLLKYEEMKRLRKEGATLQAIANSYGLTKQRIWQITQEE